MESANVAACDDCCILMPLDDASPLAIAEADALAEARDRTVDQTGN